MNKNNNKSGFTLIEMLLGIVISSAIFLTVGSMIAVLYNSDIKTKRVQVFEQTKNDLQIELSNSIRWADVISYSDNQIRSDANLYTLSDGRMYRNGSPLTTQDIKVTRMEIEDLSTSTDYKSLKFEFDFTHTQYSTMNDHMTLVVSQRNKRLNNE